MENVDVPSGLILSLCLYITYITLPTFYSQGLFESSLNQQLNIAPKLKDCFFFFFFYFLFFFFLMKYANCCPTSVNSSNANVLSSFVCMCVKEHFMISMAEILSLTTQLLKGPKSLLCHTQVHPFHMAVLYNISKIHSLYKIRRPMILCPPNLT